MIFQKHSKASFPKFLMTFAAFLVFTFAASSAQAQAKKKPAAKKQTHMIAISNFKFAPATLTVNSGDSVVWKNADVAPHTATGKGFDSGTIAAGASWRFTANKKGTYSYICSFHPTMKGRLIVK